MTDPTVTRRTFDTVETLLGAGRSLHTGLTRGADGTPETLILVATWRDGEADPRHRMELPAHVIGDLRRALETLEEV